MKFELSFDLQSPSIAGQLLKQEIICEKEISWLKPLLKEHEQSRRFIHTLFANRLLNKHEMEELLKRLTRRIGKDLINWRNNRC